MFDRRYVKRLDGPNVKKGANKMELAEQVRADIRRFKQENGLDRLVMIWCGSTEVFMTETEAHQTIEAFEKALQWQRREHPVEHGLRLRGPEGGHPVRQRRAEPDRRHPGAARPGAEERQPDLRQGLQDGPDADQDDHRARPEGAPDRRSKGWYSTNILGNRDGEVLDDPESFKTKEESKKSVLDYILQPDLYPDLYKDLCHVVRINYYPPRGDNKEGWDNIDIVGWLGYPMQLKINFLCRDSILAAPIVLDLVLFLDLAARCGPGGHPGMAVVLLQEPAAREGALPRARPVHPADEAEEHAAVPEGRGTDHAPRAGVLRLTLVSGRAGQGLVRSRCHAWHA